MASQSGGNDKVEKDLARFDLKGPRIQEVSDGKFDIMESEFRSYDLHGEVLGSEDTYVKMAKQAKEQRLVGMANGQVAVAIGSLADGSGYLVDQHGRPINRVQQAPVTPMGRKAKDW